VKNKKPKSDYLVQMSENIESNSAWEYKSFPLSRDNTGFEKSGEHEI